jgi:hypothetical protein
MCNYHGNGDVVQPFRRAAKISFAAKDNHVQNSNRAAQKSRPFKPPVNLGWRQHECKLSGPECG